MRSPTTALEALPEPAARRLTTSALPRPYFALDEALDYAVRVCLPDADGMTVSNVAGPSARNSI